MTRKAIILFSLCCAVMCAIVGYLSYEVTQESEIADTASVSLECETVLESPPTQTSRVVMTQFLPGKHLATVDYDGDQQWDSVCVPFFPRKNQKIGYGYHAVLVCFKNVPTREAFDALIKPGALEIDYWPERQTLDRVSHSLLAQKYTNMDFAKSPILYYGFQAGNPVLGETTLLASAGAGSVSLIVAFLALVSGLLKRKKSTTFDINDATQPTTNRAGLPISQSTSILDQVSSLRSSPGQ